jgi:intein/homing endonuclease
MPKENTNGRTLVGKRAAPSDKPQRSKKISRADAERRFGRLFGYQDKDGTTKLVRSITKAHRQLKEIGKVFGNRSRFFRT